MIPSPYLLMAKWVALFAVVAGAYLFGRHDGQHIAHNELLAYQDQAKEAMLVALDTVRMKEQAMNQQLEEARNAAVEREKNLLADAGRARTESERLRGDLAAIRKQLPSLTDAAVRRYAGVAGELLGECTEKYISLAAEADSIWSERMMLLDAWPKD